MIHFRLSAIQGLSFDQSWNDELLQNINEDHLQVQSFTQTIVNVAENNIKIKGGIRYTLDETPLFQLETLFSFDVKDLAGVVEFDEDKKRINFKANNMIITMVSSVIGAMRGMLFEKTADTALSDYPLPLLPMDVIMKNNTFVVE